MKPEDFDGKTALTYHDVLTIYMLLSPGYVVPAAASHGGGNPVVGAKAAWAEIKEQVRGYGEFALERARQRGVDVKLIARDMLFVQRMLLWSENTQELTLLQDTTSFRRLMVGNARGTTHVIYGLSVPITLAGWRTCDTVALRCAVVRALGWLLIENPVLNRAVLPARSEQASVWQRTTPHIVTPVEFRGDDISAVVLDPTAENLFAHLQAQFKPVIAVHRHPLYYLTNELMLDWLRAGFIGSWGGVWVSDISQGHQQWALPIFVEGAGIPISVVINPVHGDHVQLGIAIDHRALDGDHGRLIHQRLPDMVWGAWHKERPTSEVEQ